MNLLSKLLLFLCLCGCMQAENSSSLDRYLAGNDEIRQIFSTSCNGCHAYHTQTDEEMIASGLILPGDPENSQIYYRLVGSVGAKGPKNMPSGGALSAAEIEQIKVWIETL